MLCDSIREHTTIIQKLDSQMAEVLTQLTSQMTEHTIQLTSDKSTDNQMAEDTRYNIK